MRTLYDAFNDFIDYKRSYCEDETIRYYNENISSYLEWLNNNKDIANINVTDISKQDLISYIAHLRDNSNINNVTIRTYFRAVKVYFKYIYDEGYIDKDITLKIKLPKSDKKVKMPLSMQEVEIIDTIFNKSTYLGLRNYLIVHMMLDCGLRSSEVINLRVCDLDLDNKYICINKSKFNKSRVIPLSEKLLEHIKLFLKYHDNEYVFYDRYIVNTITSNTIKQLFSKLKKCTGVKRVHAHLLRHTFATSFIMGGGSLEILRLLLGHSDYNVTKEYLHIVAETQILQYDIYKLDKCMFRNYNNY